MFTLFVELVIPLDEHVLGFISIRSLNSSYRTSINEEVPIPTGKGKIYGELNERKMMCRLAKVIPHPELEGGYQCVYKHPKSDIFDRVTVGEHNMCPNNIYCDKR